MPLPQTVDLCACVGSALVSFGMPAGLRKHALSLLPAGAPQTSSWSKSSQNGVFGVVRLKAPSGKKPSFVRTVSMLVVPLLGFASN